MGCPADRPHMYKPGQSGNPGGRPKDAIDRKKVDAIMNKFSHLSRAQLEAKVNSPETTMLELMIASVMVRAVKDGDASRLNFLLDRSIGKVKDVVETYNHNFDEELDKIPKENVIELLRQMRGPKEGTNG